MTPKQELIGTLVNQMILLVRRQGTVHIDGTYRKQLNRMTYKKLLAYQNLHFPLKHVCSQTCGYCKMK